MISYDDSNNSDDNDNSIFVFAYFLFFLGGGIGRGVGGWGGVNSILIFFLVLLVYFTEKCQPMHV